jgi:hypothetical protein
MKPLIYRNPHMVIRITISLLLQVLLVLLLHHPRQDSLIFTLGIFFIAVLAMAPVAFAPRWLPFWPMLMLRLLGLFPLLILLATVLHLMGVEWVT